MDFETDRETCEWVATCIGLDLSRGGLAQNLEGLIARRRVELSCSPAQYQQMLSLPNSAELCLLIDASTVTYTWFFRDRQQLLALREVLLQGQGRSRPLQVWVAGCASGEDAYSIAILAERAGVPVEVLGTDVNSEGLARARAGRYGPFSLREVTAEERQYFEERSDGTFQICGDVRRRVRFQRHNLLHPAPCSQDGDGWDVVLCRNVLIYFTRGASLAVLDRLRAALRLGGRLILGAGEIIREIPEDLNPEYLSSRLALRKVGIVPLPTAPGLTLTEPTVAFGESAAPLSLWPAPVTPHTEQTSDVASVRLHPRLSDLLEQGHRLLEEGNVQQAEVAYREVANEEPASAEARMYLGVALFLGGHMDSANRELRAASFLDAELWPAALYLALSYENLGSAEEALREYRHVVRVTSSPGYRDRPGQGWMQAWRAELVELARRRIAAAGKRLGHSLRSGK